MPDPGAALRLRGRSFPPGRTVVMAIVNRTADSFYPGARQLADADAAAAAQRAVTEGAELLDVGGVRAGPGSDVDVEEELRRVVPFVARVRREHPELLVSVDTWRAEVAQAACDAGADLVNDTWAGHDPRLPAVAAAAGAGLVCSHTGGAAPRTAPYRVSYAGTPSGVLDDVLATLARSAARAVEAGVDPAAVLVDPTHDFGKNTWHSLLLLRHTTDIAGLGFPVLVALSRKDFVGETLGLPVERAARGHAGGDRPGRLAGCPGVPRARRAGHPASVGPGGQHPGRAASGTRCPGTGLRRRREPSRLAPRGTIGG